MPVDLRVATGAEGASPTSAAIQPTSSGSDALRRTLARIRDQIDSRPRGLSPALVRRVLDHMRSNLHRGLALDELAARVSLSRFHFCSAFRRATGRTPHEALTQLRMERAQALLAQPRASVTGIALAVGYQTHSGFSATFRRVTGMSPSDYRRAIAALDPLQGGY